MDSRTRGTTREVRIKQRKWVDVLYTHAGNYDSISARCYNEWGKKHPDHEMTIYPFELKSVVHRVMPKDGKVIKLGP